MASSRQLPASGLVLFGWAILRVSKSSLSWQIAGKWAVKKCQPADFNNMYHHWTWWTLCCIGRSDLVHCWQWGKMDWWCTYNFGWHPHYHRFSCWKCQPSVLFWTLCQEVLLTKIHSKRQIPKRSCHHLFPRPQCILMKSCKFLSWSGRKWESIVLKPND